MKTRRDVYRFTRYETEEMFDAANGDNDRMFDLAIDQARERARLYVMPCRWGASYDFSKGAIVVYRYRRV